MVEGGLTQRHQHGYGDHKESHESVEDLDGQLERAALLTPQASAPPATWSTVNRQKHNGRRIENHL